MLWPVTARRSSDGKLAVGGVPVADLAREYGTPLYIYDEETIRRQCMLFRQSFRSHDPRTRLIYAGKAYLSVALVRILQEEGFGLDVVSAGELAVARAAGFPAGEIVFHGNNKTEDELRFALSHGIGEIVIDNLYELELLDRLLRESGRSVNALLRINPGIDVHTHDYRKTGIVDSKFGLPIVTGDAERAVDRALRIDGLCLRGYHCHIGSQIFELAPFVTSVEVLFSFASQMRDRYGIEPEQISPGGGFAIEYEHGDHAAGIPEIAELISNAMREASERHGIPRPILTVEPGRSIVGQAGIAVYRAGAVKSIPGVRTYVSVDGGMADNIRPALYEARYEAELAERIEGETRVVTITGKYCESGDVLIRDITMLNPQPGELIVVPAAGAYCLAMASNYNMALRPAVVMVRQGDARLIQRREEYADLLAREVELIAAPVSR